MSSESEGELFSYGNRIKLTFGKANSKKERFSSSSESSISSEDEVTEEIVHEKVLEENLVATVSQERDLLSQSPSPPPCKKIDISEKQYISPGTNQLLQRLKQQSMSTSLNMSSDAGGSTPVQDKSFKLKVKIHGVIKKYEVFRNEPLEKLFDKIASAENVNVGNVSLSHKNVSIQKSDTLNLLKITVVDIIECVIHLETEDTILDKISLTLQQGKQRYTYTISKHEKLEKIFQMYCTENKTSIDRNTFKFDGDTCDPNSTPDELDINDGDILDVVAT